MKQKTKAYVYVLSLSGGRYYVGYTERLRRRIADHWAGNGSRWTRRNKPQAVLATFETDSEAGHALEEYVTFLLIRKHSFQQVRGAQWLNKGQRERAEQWAERKATEEKLSKKFKNFTWRP